MGRSLGLPVVHTTGGITLLTGGNVRLAPSSVLRLAARTGCDEGDGGLLAYANGRYGIVGCRGRFSDEGGRLLIHGLETFGSRGALAEFGRQLGELIAKPGRFDGLAVVERVSDPGTGAGLVVEALVEAGLEAVWAPGLGAG